MTRNRFDRCAMAIALAYMVAVMGVSASPMAEPSPGGDSGSSLVSVSFSGLPGGTPYLSGEQSLDTVVIFDTTELVITLSGALASGPWIVQPNRAQGVESESVTGVREPGSLALLALGLLALLLLGRVGRKR